MRKTKPDQTMSRSSHPIREMSIRPEYLALIASGRKTVEVRVAYPKNLALVPGQFLRFASGGRSSTTRIIKINQYPAFAAMLDHERNRAIAGNDRTRAELLATCYTIYPPDKEALGVLAIHIELLD